MNSSLFIAKMMVEHHTERDDSSWLIQTICNKLKRSNGSPNVATYVTTSHKTSDTSRYILYIENK
jgi:hypothetical protein